MVKIYVCYKDWDKRGCSEPKAVFSTEEQADEWCDKNNLNFPTAFHDYVELTLDAV